MALRSARAASLPSFVALVCLLGATVVGVVAKGASWPHYPPSLTASVALLCLFLFVGELFPIVLGHQERAVAYTFSGTATVALIAVGPGWVPLTVQLSAALVDEVRFRRPPTKAAFNLAQYALCVTAARALYCGLTHVGFNQFQPAFSPNDLLPMLAAAAAFFVSNTLLMSMVLAFARFEPVLSVFPAYVRDEAWMSSTLLAASPLLLLGLQFSWKVAPICVLPVLAVRNGAARAAQREFAAMHDPLTGLPNRALMLQRIERALATEDPGLTALVLIDLDHFKEINDSLGHPVGDELLRHVASRLQRALRQTDTSARLGGDEFAVLSTELGSVDDAVTLGHRLLDVISEPYALEEVTLHVEASVGVAVAPVHADNVDTLMQLVDVALYQAKAAGRDTVCLYDPGTDSSSAERLAMMAELRAGMDEQLVLYYQPKCRASDGALVGVEALLRWQHPKLGLLTPNRFLSSAENSGLIVPLTFNVLRMALRQLRDWDDAGLSVSVAVNISPRHLTRPDLPNLITALLAETSTAPERLTLEITENSIMTDPVRSIAVLRRLRSAGVDISIDDFGTGYSSLAYLRDLSANEVKIDRSFISGGSGSAHDLAVVRAAVQLGHSLDLRVVAEGVETAEQVRLLAEMGVDVLQGYHILPPVTASEVVAWAARPQLWAQALRNATPVRAEDTDAEPVTPS